MRDELIIPATSPAAADAIDARTTSVATLGVLETAFKMPIQTTDSPPTADKASMVVRMVLTLDIPFLCSKPALGEMISDSDESEAYFGRSG